MPAEPAQTGDVLREQDIRYVPAGVRHDRVRRVHGTAETVDLRDILPETREATRAVPVQRDAPEAIGFLPVHAAEGREVGAREQANGQTATYFLTKLFRQYINSSVSTSELYTKVTPIHLKCNGQIL